MSNNGPIKTPVEELMGNPDPSQKGQGEYNGSADWPGADKRTPSPNAVPEKTFDRIQGE